MSRSAAAAVALLLPLAACGQTNAVPSATTGGGATPTPGTPQVAPATPQAPAGNPQVAPAGSVPGAGPTPSTASPLTSQDSFDEQRAMQAAAASQAGAATRALYGYRGQRITAVRFQGVTFNAGSQLVAHLPVKAGDLLDPLKVRTATRRLYLTGRYRDIDVRVEPNGNGIALVFEGTPRYFVGRIVIEGVASGRLASILQYATQLQPGYPFVAADVQSGENGIRQSLEQSGYYVSTIRSRTLKREDGHQIDIFYNVVTGNRALVGNVAVSGDPGITTEKFRDVAKLNTKNTTLKVFHTKNKVNRETVSTGLDKLRTYYQKHDRLEAAISLEKSNYTPAQNQLDYQFIDHEGPLVKIVIEGVKVSNARKKQLLPIYEEGAVDNDLLNEGAHNIREFLARQGYFDAEVTPTVSPKTSTNEVAPDGSLLPPPSSVRQLVTFDAVPGKRYKVKAVNIKGNKYFDTANIRERMTIVKADPFNRYGKFSPALLSNDKDSIESLYRSNGFEKVEVTAKEVKSDADAKVGEITVDVSIDEGPQQKYGKVTLTGVDPSRMAEMKNLISAQDGQPYSTATLVSDRDNLLQEYLADGFENATVLVKQTVEKADPLRTDIEYVVSEGQQVFVNRILITGPVHTKPKLIVDQLQLKAGDPLDQSALAVMQQRFYDLALFSEANVAIQNPNGQIDRKNVLVQLTEAKRWDVTYGAGFEAQLSTPQPNCRAQASLGEGRTGTNCSPEGTAGASFRVSADVTRINLFGTDKSVTLHTTYGLLERIATVTLSAPRLFGDKNLTAQVSGGYTNVQNISTFKASTLQGLFRITQKVPKADTFLYDFQYRRVSVDQNSLQVTANLIPLLSQPVVVGGPGFTWFHDTRNPSPLDATKGVYLNFSDFLAEGAFGSQQNFNRMDTTFATYYSWGTLKHRYTFARLTRFGFIQSWGPNPNTGVNGCQGVLLTTNASCNAVPLPERLYAGGATSDRGFAINAAGPRDLSTGYPVGGNSVFVNTFELRLPAPTLPVVGDSLSFVVFHDMGNVFLHLADTFPSFLRFHQPDENTCREVTGFKTVGTCNFNYFSHDIGLGARYHTPVGPIRLDFAYNLNPPVYPIIDDYSQPLPNHQVGQASHFQFFFSIGQSF